MLRLGNFFFISKLSPGFRSTILLRIITRLLGIIFCDKIQDMKKVVQKITVTLPDSNQDKSIRVPFLGGIFTDNNSWNLYEVIFWSKNSTYYKITRSLETGFLLDIPEKLEIGNYYRYFFEFSFRWRVIFPPPRLFNREKFPSSTKIKEKQSSAFCERAGSSILQNLYNYSVIAKPRKEKKNQSRFLSLCFVFFSTSIYRYNLQESRVKHIAFAEEMESRTCIYILVCTL